ncbi:MAG: hypothetical protein HQK55_02350 [Deltaproteobacteria bacterium]|nr:hypothetical protein [Deltaproteobacteria bacterium]
MNPVDPEPDPEPLGQARIDSMIADIREKIYIFIAQDRFDFIFFTASSSMTVITW